MSCVNFKSKEKNNKWREVELNLEKEKSISKYFGIDTETRVNELLQNNITLLDWIRKNQGYPYFIGRRINGENALSSEEISYISSNGSKTMPILRVISDKSAKENAKIAVALLEDLEIAKQIPVFVEIDADTVTEEFLKDFATEILSNEYIPGFYVDTDSYHNFDRQFSRAYQSDEKLMKQCKIWALSPEMEEFFETQNGHSEKPEIWGPFAPSCISKEQISFWQYGKKSHPIKTYKGERADFNLNLTIEPNNIFSICEAKVLNYTFKKDDKYKFEVCVSDGKNVETANVECDFITTKSDSILVNKKTYAKDISSDHNVLEFVICKNNDMFSPEYTVAEGNVLVKFAFVSKENSIVYRLKKLISLSECELLEDIITKSLVTEDESEIQNISFQEIWLSKFVMPKIFNEENSTVDIVEENTSNIENYMYKANEEIFASEIINVSKMRSSISGDTHNIFATIPQSAVKHSGSQYCTIKDVYGRPTTAYYKDTLYQDGNYYTKIAIWDLDISSYNSSDQSVAFTCRKSQNAFVYYYPNSDRIQVVYADDNHSYVITTQTQISLNLTGYHTAYINKAIFEVALGGDHTPTLEPFDVALDILGEIVDEKTIFGKILGVVSYIDDVMTVLDIATDIITNYNYNVAMNEYTFSPNCGLVTKQVGSIFRPALGFKDSALKVKCILNNVSFCPTSKVYGQICTQVLSTFNGNNECIYFGGSVPLQ